MKAIRIRLLGNIRHLIETRIAGRLDRSHGKPYGNLIVNTDENARRLGQAFQSLSKLRLLTIRAGAKLVGGFSIYQQDLHNLRLKIR